MAPLQPAACEHARARASLALDCELSELEQAQLRSHLRACSACEAFVAGLREVTHELRAAPLPAPSRPLVPRPHRSRRVPLVVAALAVAVAAAGGVAAGALSRAPATAAAVHVLPVALPGTRLTQQTAV